MKRVASSLILCASFASFARADSVTYSTTAGPFAVGASGTVQVNQFDPALGVLRLARVTIFGRVSGTWSVENTDAAPTSVFGYASGHYVGVLVVNSMGHPAPNPAFIEDPPALLAAYDGTLDFAGPSAASRTFANASGDGSPSVTYDRYTDAALQPYPGTGTVGISIGPILGTGPNLPPWIQSTHTVVVDLIVTVRYEYDPFPAKMCFAASWSGCPCGNAGPGNHGCGNSVNALGGALDGAGTPSLSADSLVLSGTGMTNSNALYFQGTTFGHAQTVYGDGLRCVAGNVARLGAKLNAGGASQYPAPGDPPVSVRGGVVAPGTRYYQVIYRDGGAFCTPSQFNGTSAFAVLWSP